MSRIGIIGLGVMGSGMAQNLAESGWDVRGFDPAPGAIERQPYAITAVSIPDLAATVPYLLLSLPGVTQVEEVMATLCAAPRDGLVVVDTSTSDPAVSRDIAARAAAAGVHYVDSPVSGGRAGALAGSLRSFVGGAPEAVAAAGPVLEAITGGRAVPVGGPGAGHLVKLLNNAMVAAHLAIAGEALSVADAFGLDIPTVLGAINGATGRSAATEVNLPTWVLSESFDSGFTMGLMARDVDLAARVSRSAGAPVEMLSLAAERWAAMRDQAGPGADFNESVRVIRAAVAPAA